MRIPFSAIALFLSSLSMPAESARFYVGTYTNKTESKGIYTATLDTETGRLGPVAFSGEARNPSFLALAPDGRSLYAAMEADGGAVGAFSVGPEGKLTPLNTAPSGGAGACHVWVDASGRNALVANYSGGNIASIAIKDDGSLGEQTALVQFSGSGPHKRQGKSFAHAIYTSPDDRFAYACDLGSDKVWTFQFDPEKGSLTPTSPDSASVPPGGGPRHLALHPGGKFAYANNEMSLTVTAFSRDPETGVLTPIQTLPTSEKLTGETPGITTAEIVCHPSGKWLYVSSRGDDIVAVYSIAEDGRLELIQNAPAGVEHPRGMDIDPSGRWIVTSGQKDNRIAVLKVDPETGKLTLTDQAADIPAPVCVLFSRK